MVQRFGLVLMIAVMAPVDGQTIVQSKGPGAWGAQLRLVEELRIGELEGAPEYTFGASISHLTVGLDGAIFVAEGRPVLVRMYDANGRFVRKVGGDGEGPGEYRTILGLETMRDGRIALRDNRIARITIYDARGDFVTSHRVQSGYYSAGVFRVDTAGNFYVKVPRRPGPPTLDPAMVWIKVSSTGQVSDSISIPVGATPSVQTYGGPARNRLEPLLASWSPLGYFVTGAPGRYAFAVHRKGQPVLRVQREHTPVRVARAEKAEWDAAAEFESRQPTSQTFTTGPDGKRLVIDGPTMKYAAPLVKPAYRGLEVDDEGRIWVERYVEAVREPPPPSPNQPPPPGTSLPPVSLWREPVTYDVFEPTGRFLGTIVRPPRTNFLHMRGRHIWGTRRGEFDELYIVRYRIEPVSR